MRKQSNIFVFLLMFYLFFPKLHADSFDELQNKINSLIEQGDYKAADTAIAEMKADFADNPEPLSWRLYDIAHKYSQAGAEGRFRSICEQIVSEYPETIPAVKAELHLYCFDIKQLIEDKNYNKAETEIEKIRANYNDMEMGYILEHIADKYREIGLIAKAKSLYKKALINYPQSGYLENLYQAKITTCDILELVNSSKKSWTDIIDMSRFEEYFTNSEEKVLVAHILAEMLSDKAVRTNGEQRVNLVNYSIELYENNVLGKTENKNIIPEAYFVLSNNFYSIKNYSKAIGFYDKLLDEFPKYQMNWHAQFMVGHIYEKMLEKGLVSISEAEQHIKSAYTKVLDKYPHCKAAKIAEMWLDRN
jgi:tetratricopeptide (TPR) repeat protein